MLDDEEELQEIDAYVLKDDDVKSCMNFNSKNTSSSIFAPKQIPE